MKKWFALLLITALGLLSACSGGNSSAGSSASSQAKASETPAASSAPSTKDAGAKQKLVLWHIETGKREDVIKHAVARFQEKHPNVEVEVVQNENDPYKTKLTVAMGGGNPPDIFHSWGGGWLKQFIDSGQVLDITGKIDKNTYVPAALSVSTFDGKNYGAPLAMAGVPVWYNKEIFDKYKLTPPKTYKELLDIIKTLNDHKVIPFALANKSKWPGAFYLMYFADRIGGADLFKEAFARSGRGFDDPAYVKAGEMIQELVKANAFPKGFNGLNYDTGQSRQLLYAGKAAMIIQGTWLLNNVRSEAPDFEKNLDIFPFPAIDGGKGDSTDIVGGVSPVFSVSAKSKNPDLAIELVKELTSKESAQEAVDNAGSISAVKGVNVKDEFSKKFVDFLNQANNMQTYYDQTLPPELAELHKDTTQGLFGLSMTPEEAAQKMEAKAKELLKK